MRADEQYASGKACRQAVRAKLEARARSSRWEIPQLQRQLAYDRLLERL